jgi:hypothetical protein
MPHEAGERLVVLVARRLFSVQVLLFANVVSMDPAILLLAILSFKEDIPVVFSSHYSDARRHFLRRRTCLLRLDEECSNCVVCDWLGLEILVQLGNRFHRTCLEKLGPELRKQRARGINIRTVYLAVDGKNVMGLQGD